MLTSNGAARNAKPVRTGRLSPWQSAGRASPPGQSAAKGGSSMRPTLSALAAAAAILIAASAATAQKPGGTLRIQHRDSPASMSIHEEATVSTSVPIMAVMNNLVIYDQHIPQNSMETIRPDLAESWTWSEDGKELTFKLRQGVTWHDGKKFTAADVKCTFDLIQGKAKDRFRINPRKDWYHNLDRVSVHGEYEAVFHLKRPQPALLALLASGYTPIYPCHVPPQQMRQHPIGTGPFKFVEFRPNEYIKLERNPDYWKPGRPYLDAIEYKIVPSRSTAVLAFIAGQFDMTWPYSVTVPLLKDVKEQAPHAHCELHTTNVTTNLLVNRDAPPFDNAELRRAMALTLDRKAFIDILHEGKAKIGGAMLPPPAGQWGMPPEMLRTIPGYGEDVVKNREEARRIMEKLGYGPGKRLELKVSTRNLPGYRDPAVILIDQLKEIYIDGVLDTVETANWHSKVTRKDYAVALNATGSGVDDPDQQFYENYACGSPRNYSGYCNKALDRKFDEQSMTIDQEQRKRLVWEIDRILQEDQARPIISHNIGATCMQPHVKGLTTMANSIYNGWRLEDVWLDK
jgi:peptide/nickel transport system substrate-binding protein